ncbi:ATP-binding cassette domain-containing protein [Brachybacterium sp. UMB0905]|uniref:ATP-binding cassette domain-containing protein n=1 Tax=Brachybacterium sp. UMB0905 TaxID=2069310 RepID=UPI000C801221|nr:ATP-binding cassette domain-containing protein [Brachybacterium sp. UMB0905]PMC74314.1 ABC transporter ATP-binding protein [Brachybacterium sp. UMB0905]
MGEPVLVTKGLAKVYGAHRVVDQVDLRLERGRVYGLIGRNGAGKTTLMRVITALARPSAGRVELFDSGADAPRQEDLRRIGTLIESPALHGGMTAAQNLRLHRIMRGIPDPGHVREQELLELVGLADTGRKHAGDFSLGMRQRLGIALALVGDPQLLVLDEPVNGLDPLGVVQVRQLVRELALERGLTVLISSHNLPELFQTATDHIIIDAGRILQTLTHDQLVDRTRSALEITAASPELLVTALREAFGDPEMTVLPDGTVRLVDRADQPEQVLRELVARDVWPTHLAQQGESLESYFLSVVGGSASETTAEHASGEEEGR